jgi:hypothetical protein
MPLQETYLEKTISQGRALVIKTWAREAFENLNDGALEQVAATLHLGDLYEIEDIPSIGSPDYRDFLWETLSDEAREDGQIKSFFIVMREISGRSPEPLYVSADWPSTEIFVEGL